MRDSLGVHRPHGAIWNWTHTLSETQSDPPTAGVVCAAFERVIAGKEIDWYCDLGESE